MARPVARALLWTALSLSLVLVAALLWRGSDARATDSTVAAPPAPPAGIPAGTLSEAWSAPADPAPRQVVVDGRVVVGSAHGVAALDPLSGREVWHYLRANALLCGLAATDGVAVAVFRTADRCDEAVALTAATGVRAWNRMVDFTGPAVLSDGPRTVVGFSSTSVADIDPTSDTIRWSSDASPECRLTAARAGAAGVAVLQSCRSSAPQLRLLDGATGTQRWTTTLAPEGRAELAGADGVVTAVVGDRLQVYSTSDGALLQSLPLPPAAGGAGAAALSVADVVLVVAHGTASALDRTTGAARWQHPALGLPGVGVAPPGGPGGPVLLVPEAGAFVYRDPSSGAEVGRSAAPGLAAGGSTEVAGPVVVYRLPGRVIAYR